MRRFGWVVGLGPPLLLAAGAVLVPQSFVAGAAKTSCPPAFAARGAKIDAQVSLATVLSSQAEVSGRKLTITAGPASRTISLAAEAFATEPVANVVAYGQNDPAAGSTVRALDLQSGCDYALWQTVEVVRSAVIAPDLRSLYIHSVSQATRADLGVTRVNLRTLAATNVVTPPDADANYGVTFATLLHWSLDDDALAVQSCAAERCRTRVLDLATGQVSSFAGNNQGPVVGITRGKIATFDACPGLPCGLSWIDRTTGRATPVDVGAYSANLDEDGQGPVLTVSTSAGSREFRP
jgi:hypothetical protein